MKLEANWKKLMMANYIIDPGLLSDYVPFRTEMDYFSGSCYISLVGFMFLDSKLGGIPIPFHQSFEEVNLRFYIRFKEDNIWKRGVVFIKEIVPKPAVTFVANSFYQEHYETCFMQHAIEILPERQRIEYRWKKEKWNAMHILSDLTPKALRDGSAEEFFTEHYWGYTRINDQLTLEYSVEHPRWMAYDTISYAVDVDFGACYGEIFDFLSRATPESVFLAEGSAIILEKGNKIKKE